MIVINLNGPAKSGKDTICELLKTKIDSEKYIVTHMEFKKLLFDIAIRAAGVSETLWEALYTRDYKEKPSPYLRINGEDVSPRQWMIHCSESLMKPVFGNGVFGEAFSNKLKDLEAEFSEEDRELAVVVSDGGFIEESIPVVDFVGANNYYLVRLHRLKKDGKEYDFAGDSRRYIFAKEFPAGLQPNETDIMNAEGDVEGTVEKIINYVESKDA